MKESETICPKAKQECELSAQKKATSFTSMFEDSMQKPLKQRILNDAILRRTFIIWLCLCVVFAILVCHIPIVFFYSIFNRGCHQPFISLDVTVPK